jgi:hypothetical protein
MKPHLQQILAVVFFALLCLASPFVPSVWATLFSASLIVLMAGIVMRAIFSVGQKRIFALGFLVLSLTYIFGVFYVDDFRFHQLGGVMPTTQLLQTFVQPPIAHSSAIQIVGPVAKMRYTHGSCFIPLGHLLIAVALGYCGGTYARYLRPTTPYSHSIPNGAKATA